MVEVLGPFAADHSEYTRQDGRFCLQGYVVTKQAVEKYVLARKSWVMALYEENLEYEEQQQLLSDIAKLFLTTVVNFRKMREERDELNGPVNESRIPPVLPIDVAMLELGSCTLNSDKKSRPCH